jgi:hypothetical protein
MRRGHHQGRAGQNDREAFALLVFGIEIRRVGQALEWEYGAPTIDLAARI